jgi:hypothetical protein
MELQDETSRQETDKAAVDASLAGSITISTDGCAIDPAAFWQALLPLLQSMQNEDRLALKPLRLVVLTAKLGDTVGRWQRALGQAEAGVSQQPEGSAAAKTMSWGTDEESARSVVILADYIAAGVIANNSIAIATIAHELGHVHDEFLRGMVLGFPKSQTPPGLADWARVRGLLAEIAWSEFAAESVAARRMTQEDLCAFLLNDPQYLAGIDERFRRAVWSYKRKERTFASLWSSAVTELSDVFGNLGRATARLPFADNGEEAFARLVNSNLAGGRWKPVIEGLGRELETLGSKRYSEWGATPFGGIEEAVTEGFRAVGLFPVFDGNNLNVRVQ